VNLADGVIGRVVFIAAEEVLQFTASFEPDRSLGWNVHRFQCLGVLCHTGAALPDFKNAKITKLQSVVFAQLNEDAVQEGLNNILDRNSFDFSGFRDLINQFFLCDCRHKMQSSSMPDHASQLA